MTIMSRMSRPKDRVTDRRAEFAQRLREHDVCRNVPLSHYLSGHDPLAGSRELPQGINAGDDPAAVLVGCIVAILAGLTVGGMILVALSNP